MTGPYTSAVWDVVRDASVRRLDLAVISLLLLLLVEYDLVRAHGSERALARLRGIGVIVLPLLIVVAVVVAHRWSELR
jgi:hypothetical protein